MADNLKDPSVSHHHPGACHTFDLIDQAVEIDLDATGDALELDESADEAHSVDNHELQGSLSKEGADSGSSSQSYGKHLETEKVEEQCLQKILAGSGVHLADTVLQLAMTLVKL